MKDMKSTHSNVQLPCQLLRQLQTAPAPAWSPRCGGDRGGEDGEGHDQERGRDVVQVRGPGPGPAGEGGRQPLWHLETVPPDDQGSRRGEGCGPDPNQVGLEDNCIRVLTVLLLQI